jgi:hypothetical protein
MLVDQIGERLFVTLGEERRLMQVPAPQRFLARFLGREMCDSRKGSLGGRRFDGGHRTSWVSPFGVGSVLSGRAVLNYNPAARFPPNGRKMVWTIWNRMNSPGVAWDVA